MQFGADPAEGFKHSLTFEAADHEVEAVASAYRELVNTKAAAGNLDKIQPHERDFAMWPNVPDRTIFTNRPLSIAILLENFYDRTKEAVNDIATLSTEAAFDSDAVPRRLYLAEIAFNIAGLIKLQYDADTLQELLNDQGVELFSPGQSAPRHPYD